MIFETISNSGHEQVVFCQSKDAGLKAIIAIHNTVLGPPLGGLRMWLYKSEQEALNDVLRLSRGMTYKNAVAGLNLGGGKAVIIGDPAKDKSEPLFRALGRFINSSPIASVESWLLAMPQMIGALMRSMVCSLTVPPSAHGE